jgi:hypothetical protein
MRETAANSPGLSQPKNANWMMENVPMAHPQKKRLLMFNLINAHGTGQFTFTIG